MSLKRMPGFGKSGTSRMRAFSDSMLKSTFTLTLLRFLLTDVEAGIRAGCDGSALEVLDLGERRTLPQPLLESRQRVVFPLAHHFNAAVGQVPCETRDPERGGLAHHEI